MIMVRLVIHIEVHINAYFYLFTCDDNCNHFVIYIQLSKSENIFLVFKTLNSEC